MVSGDHIETAKQVAIKSGILTKDSIEEEHVCMDATKFQAEVGGLQKVTGPDGVERDEVVRKEKFEQIAHKLKLLARATPEDKHTLVVGL